jgi:hypothetical protein
MISRVWSSAVVALLNGFITLTIPSPAAAGEHVSTDSVRGATEKQPLAAVAVHAKRGLTCKLYTDARQEQRGISLVTDDDGYARFYALRVDALSSNRHQILACKDIRGAASSYAVDLAAADTFIAHPIDLKRERGRDRPALQGDPMSLSQQELVAKGYGLRPDPRRSPDNYAVWLLAASRSARTLEIKRVLGVKAGPIITQAPAWAGSVLAGAPHYVSVQAYMNVPTAIPGGDGTGGTISALWIGLGGFGSGSGLIQSGIFISTTAVAAGYASFREYCCGDPNGVDFGGAFVPNPGDVLFIQNWYCDADGSVDLNGAFGCSFIHDLTSGALLNCTTANTVCPAAQGLTLCSVDNTVPNCMTPGTSAEFIDEEASDQQGNPVAYTPFTPTVVMSGSALSDASGAGQFFEDDVTNDPTTFLLTDWTTASTHLDVQVGTSFNTTCFTIYGQSQPNVTCPPNNQCLAGHLPCYNSPIDRGRLEEIVAVILFGIIQDAGGIAVVDGRFVHIPPRGPISESLASLPNGLSERIAPLLKELPTTPIGINALAAQLTKNIVDYRDKTLSESRQP